MIVEDNKELATELKQFLVHSGYLCKIASDWENAIDKINSNDYDNMLLDLGLPNGSGFEVLKYDSKKINFRKKNKLLFLENNLEHAIYKSIW